MQSHSRIHTSRSTAICASELFPRRPRSVFRGLRVATRARNLSLDSRASLPLSLAQERCLSTLQHSGTWLLEMRRMPLPGLTRTTHRTAQQSKNAELLTDLDVRGLRAVAEEHAPPSPEKKKEPTKRAPKPKVEPLPRVSEDLEAAIKAREERGLRSSSRVKDKLLGVTPTPAPSSVTFVSDGEEETEYYEGGRRVRTGGGGALIRGSLRLVLPESRVFPDEDSCEQHRSVSVTANGIRSATAPSPAWRAGRCLGRGWRRVRQPSTRRP